MNIFWLGKVLANPANAMQENVKLIEKKHRKYDEDEKKTVQSTQIMSNEHCGWVCREIETRLLVQIATKQSQKKFFRCFTISMSFFRSGRRIGMPVEIKFCLRLPKLQSLVIFSFWFYIPRSINSVLFVFPPTALILPWEFSRGKEQVIEGNKEKKIDNFQWFYFWWRFFAFLSDF